MRYSELLMPIIDISIVRDKNGFYSHFKRGNIIHILLSMTQRFRYL
jgi:hypothetical protein